MVFLLDESNIHRPNGISSVALVHVAGIPELTSLDAHILKIEQTLNIDPFHWAGSNWAVREKFLRATLEQDFRVRVALTPNPVHIESFLERILPYLITERHVQRLIVDGSKPKDYARHLKKVLRDKGITVRKLRNETDHARPALRVADCLAGLARHYAEQPSGRGAQLYREIESRIDVVLGK